MRQEPQKWNDKAKIYAENNKNTNGKLKNTNKTSKESKKSTEKL